MSEVEAAPGDNSDSRHSLGVKKQDVDETSSSENPVFSADMDSLPPGYFTSPFFLGTMVASGLAIGGVR